MIHQIRRFASVGAIATLAHVTLAMVVSAAFDAPPQSANLAGFALAVVVSYLGHAFLTFDRASEHLVQVPRFLILSLSGLALSSAITALVCSILNGPLAVAQALVVATVPLLTFLGSKFWAFAR